MTQGDQIELYEKKIQEFQKVVEHRDKMRKLTANKLFKELILEEFCVNECARYVRTSVNPRLDADSRANALHIAQSTGHLRMYLEAIEQMGNQAEQEIVKYTAAIDELRSEPQES